MTEENKIKAIEKVKDVGEEAQKAYLEYALSVIMERALPDERDGLKPVHRRILYAMQEMKISHVSSYKKSARIVGDVIGKYHPHGDTAVYDSLVRMAQLFSMRLPLIDGQGNFGSPDGDSPAAMRYTEARMGKFSSKYMFDDIAKDTVIFNNNYDGSEVEPEVFPLKYPNLIINGVQGIAVGMATDIPPHNPIEAMEVVLYKARNRLNGVEDVLEEMIEIMPAPDFPTGAHIHGMESREEVWTTGSGKITLRAKWLEDEISSGRTLITITDLPYQVKKQELVEKIEDLIKPNQETGFAKIEGVQSIADVSDRNSVVRVELIIKKDYDVDLVMNNLLNQTELQKTISYNPVVLVKKNNRVKPVMRGLNYLFETFINHRLEVILKRSIFDQEKLSKKMHILEGLKKAIDPNNIDKVITTIKSNKDLEDAKKAIIDLLQVTEVQAQEILQIRLSRLVGIEVENLNKEIEDISLKINYLSDIILNENARLNVLIEESEDLISDLASTQSPNIQFYNNAKYPFRDRLSTFQVSKIQNDKAALTKEEECNIIITSNGYMRRIPLTSLSTMNRGARGKKQIQLTDGDFIQKSITSNSHDNLLFVTNAGRVYLKPAFEITDNIKGKHVNWILELSNKNEKVVDVLPVNLEDSNNLLAMFTKKGLVKLSKLSDYKSAFRKGGVKGVTLKENDEILCSKVCLKSDSLFMVNSKNLIIRFMVEDINIVGRTASGVIGMKLDKGVNIVGAGVIDSEDGYIVCISENGLIKLTKSSQYRIQSRSGKGLAVMKTNERSGLLFNSFYVDNLESNNVVVTTKKGFSNSRPLMEFNVTNRTTTGVKLLTIEKGDQLTDVFNALRQDEVEEDQLEVDCGEIESQSVE